MYIYIYTYTCRVPQKGPKSILTTYHVEVQGLTFSFLWPTVEGVVRVQASNGPGLMVKQVKATSETLLRFGLGTSFGV